MRKASGISYLNTGEPNKWSLWDWASHKWSVLSFSFFPLSTRLFCSLLIQQIQTALQEYSLADSTKTPAMM